jgi:hypothetical protein
VRAPPTHPERLAEADEHGAVAAGPPERVARDWSRPGFADTSLLGRKGFTIGKGHRPYPPEFRQQMIKLVRAGRGPEELAREFEPSAQSIWISRLAKIR